MYAKGLSTHQISEQIEGFPSDTALLKALYLSTFENGLCLFEDGD